MIGGCFAVAQVGFGGAVPQDSERFTKWFYS